ncbi:universal stress protein [Streptomyces xantholiticus]
MSRNVTVGIDESRESLAAAEWAADEALGRDRLLRLVHVWGTDHMAVTSQVDPEAQRRWADALLVSAAEHVRRLHSDVRLETAQVSGDPAEALTAESEGAELLVLGSRGIGALVGFIAGSVSLAVLARARHPVVLVRAHEPEESKSAPAAGAVVIGLDLRRPCDAALTFAFECADRYGCGVRVVHSWSLPPMYGPNSAGVLPMLPDEVSAQRQQELEVALAPWGEKFPDVTVIRQCQQGHAAQDLVEASPEARMIVVGLRHRSSRLGVHVGPVVSAVLHHTAAPVAVVPHD